MFTEIKVLFTGKWSFEHFSYSDPKKWWPLKVRSNEETLAFIYDDYIEYPMEHCHGSEIRYD